PALLRPAFGLANLFLSRSTKTGAYAALSEEIREATGAFFASSRKVPFCSKKTSREEMEKLMSLSAELSGVPWQ
ncbi:MAG: hypothetical protein JW852_08335, partial [Spirochaetales bacterium]|nr:hypothetical protein [Spirochaetales bacterium]